MTASILQMMMMSAVSGNDSNTKLLCHFDGADGSTTFRDYSSSNRTATAGGNAQIDTAQSKFGGASFLCDGTGDGITYPNHADFSVGTGDFTIDFWARFNATSNCELVSYRGSGSVFGPWVIGIVSAQVQLYMSSSGAAWNIISAGAFNNPSTNTWYHYALVRNGANMLRFVDGVLINTTNIGAGTTPMATVGTLNVGSQSSAGSLNGWLDEVRVSIGIARWTAAFTPPAQPYG